MYELGFRVAGSWERLGTIGASLFVHPEPGSHDYAPVQHDMYNIDASRNYQFATLFKLSASILVAIHVLACATHVVRPFTLPIQSPVQPQYNIDASRNYQFAHAVIRRPS